MLATRRRWMVRSAIAAGLLASVLVVRRESHRRAIWTALADPPSMRGSTAAAPAPIARRAAPSLTVPVPFDQFRQRFADGVCAKYESCGRIRRGHSSCLRTFARTFPYDIRAWRELARAMVRGETVYDGERAALELRALAEAPCDHLNPYVPIHAFKGTRTAGERCVGARGCIDGLRCEGNWRWSHEYTRAVDTGHGRCTERGLSRPTLADGADCSGDGRYHCSGFCNDQTHRCEGRRRAGSACDEHEECAEALWCHQGVCERLATRGERCDTAFPVAACEGQLVCLQDGVCRERSELGQPCRRGPGTDARIECAYGLGCFGEGAEPATGTCQPQRFEGEPCEVSGDCDRGLGCRVVGGGKVCADLFFDPWVPEDLRDAYLGVAVTVSRVWGP